MDDRSLFEVKKVPGEAPKFQYSSPCNRCGSRDHSNGACSTAALHIKKVQEKENEREEFQRKLARKRGGYGE